MVGLLHPVGRYRTAIILKIELEIEMIQTKHAIIHYKINLKKVQEYFFVIDLTYTDHKLSPNYLNQQRVA